jgi:hypothetical protein
MVGQGIGCWYRRAPLLGASSEEEEQQENWNGDPEHPEQDVTYLSLLQAVFSREAGACFHDTAASRPALPLVFRILWRSAESKHRHVRILRRSPLACRVTAAWRKLRAICQRQDGCEGRMH